MTELTEIGAVVEHELFPEVDVALRRGRHVDRDDAAWYAFLTDAQAELERFYRRFGAELIQRADGFFFLLPTGDKLGRRQLSPGEMLVGQGLTLLYLDPATIEQGGVATREQLLSQLSAAMGTDALMQAFNAKKRRHDERFAQEMVRTKVSEAVRRLASLGFVALLPGEQIRLRASLMRFAEPVRGAAFDADALSRLVASGELTLSEDATDADSTEASELDELDAANADAESEESEPADLSGEPESMLPSWQEPSEDWGARFDVEPLERESEEDGDAPPETSS
jgi:chromosome partition protein MukE